MNQARTKMLSSGLFGQNPPPQRSVFRAFIQRPLQTGAVVASSRQLAAMLSDKARVDLGGTVVELGSGTGVVTEQILELSPSSARLVSLELDEQLALLTQQRCPGVDVRNVNALEIKQVLKSMDEEQCDSVVSSIPWANIDAITQSSILDAVGSVLKPGGHFSTFAYVHGMWLPNARRFYRELESRYGEVETSRVVWANIPPAVVYSVTLPEV